VTASTSDGYNTTTCTPLEYVEIDEGASAVTVGAAVTSNARKGAAGAVVAENNNNKIAGFVIVALIALFLYMKLGKKK
jgi:hypothetical protein